MRLEIASLKAIKYAVMNFHYAKRMTAARLSFSVFNDKGEWCGVICYGLPQNQSKDFKLNGNEVMELLRVALNGKQECTSKAVGISMRLAKKHAPLVKMLISYADQNQNHIGTIYQATNWYYVGEAAFDKRIGIYLDGETGIHRSLMRKFGTTSEKKLKQMLGDRIQFKSFKPKHKYIYPFDKKLIPFCEKLSKPYPKPVRK